MPAYLGSAGWNIPRSHRARFVAAGSQLARYASSLGATEINSSFYRPHARATYEKWAAAVPAGFRFAVKIPKIITHDRKLTRGRQPLERFLGEVAGLGSKLGPLLIQLPPSFAFDSRRVDRFFELLRAMHDGAVVCEPRHPTWTRATTRISRPISRMRSTRSPARCARRPSRPGASSTTPARVRRPRTHSTSPPVFARR